MLNYFVSCIHLCVSLSAMVSQWKRFDLESYDSMSLAREHRNRSKINAFCEWQLWYCYILCTSFVGELCKAFMAVNIGHCHCDAIVSN